MVTYNSIIDWLKSFAASHGQLNTFYSGYQWNFQAKENIYPAMIAVPGTSTIQRGDTEILFNIVIVDLVNKDGSNKDEIYSDTLQIHQDLFASLNNSDIDWYVDDSGFTCDPLEEVSDDILCGWISTMVIKFPFDGNVCNVPI